MKDSRKRLPLVKVLYSETMVIIITIKSEERKGDGPIWTPVAGLPSHDPHVPTCTAADGAETAGRVSAMTCCTNVEVNDLVHVSEPASWILTMRHFSERRASARRPKRSSSDSDARGATLPARNERHRPSDVGLSRRSATLAAAIVLTRK